ncbi:hypothetical protein MGWOODY_Clf126 [hydrothermal vent metagenome]|uniref:Uncharacterized protein n=1 Tax=hydrothermal vent metagenome TaxID=652676 RepID=A0A160VFU8_9ZZZZ
MPCVSVLLTFRRRQRCRPDYDFGLKAVNSRLAREDWPIGSVILY